MESLDTKLPEENKKQKKNPGNTGIKIAIMASLALTISGNTFTHSRNKDSIFLGKINELQGTENMNKSLDIISEQLFKTAVAEALAPINDLQDISAGGIQLKYPPTATEKLPNTINFYPKKMFAEKIPFTIITIGKIMYVVSPDLGFMVDDMYIDETSFHITVSQKTLLGNIRKTVSKSKNKEMPNYLARLLNEGEKGRYMGSSLIVVTSPEEQLKYFKKLNEVNKVTD